MSIAIGPLSPYRFLCLPEVREALVGDIRQYEQDRKLRQLPFVSWLSMATAVSLSEDANLLLQTVTFNAFAGRWRTDR